MDTNATVLAISSRPNLRRWIWLALAAGLAVPGLTASSTNAAVHPRWPSVTQSHYVFPLSTDGEVTVDTFIRTVQDAAEFLRTNGYPQMGVIDAYAKLCSQPSRVRQTEEMKDSSGGLGKRYETDGSVGVYLYIPTWWERLGRFSRGRQKTFMVSVVANEAWGAYLMRLNSSDNQVVEQKGRDVLEELDGFFQTHQDQTERMNWLLKNSDRIKDPLAYWLSSEVFEVQQQMTVRQWLKEKGLLDNAVAHLLEHVLWKESSGGPLTSQGILEEFVLRSVARWQRRAAQGQSYNTDPLWEMYRLLKQARDFRSGRAKVNFTSEAIASDLYPRVKYYLDLWQKTTETNRPEPHAGVLPAEEKARLSAQCGQTEFTLSCTVLFPTHQ